jgi:hypothetical protein
LFVTGLCHLKESQDRDLPPELHYIRYIGEVPISALTVYEDDEPINESGEILRIVICMTKQSSHRLLHAQYLQSDIAFKRIVGFLEFEIGGFDQNASIGVNLWGLMNIRRTDMTFSTDLLSSFREPPISSRTSANLLRT